ncbi:MAG: hypothetical protein ACREA7_03345 [Nitrosotalea sp.]
MSNYETVYLDTIDGFEFENLCTKIFERLKDLLVKIVIKQYVVIVPIGQDDSYFLRRYYVKHVLTN